MPDETSALPELVPDVLGFERALAIGAHPDDCEFYAGATLARLAQSGVAVHARVVTDGGRGSVELRDIARIRAEEQPTAFEALGITSYDNLGELDGEVERSATLVARLVHAIRKQRPDLVLTHDPRTLFRVIGDITQPGHSDHRATGQAVLDAIYPRASLGTFFPEQLDEPGVALWYPRELWLFDSASPDAWVDGRATLEAKRAALRAHASQNANDALVRYAERRGHETFVRLVLRRSR